jgi:hypothetical protein
MVIVLDFGWKIEKLHLLNLNSGEIIARHVSKSTFSRLAQIMLAQIMKEPSGKKSTTFDGLVKNFKVQFRRGSPPQ